MFLPVIPSSGIGGWQYLQRTYDRQVDLFAKSPQIERDISYFKEKITQISSAQDLVQDRRLLSVALGAFGLQDDINNRFFIQKILEEGTTASDSLANRFSDNRYQDFSKAFSLGPGEASRVSDPAFAEEIVAQFRASSFEVAVGEQDDNMRIALYAQRVLGDIIGPPEKSQEQIDLERISAIVDDLAEDISEEASYFENQISKIATVDELVEDRRLLEFALKAFGLHDDFEEIVSFEPESPDDVNEAEERIKSVLSEGSISVVAAANELGDPRYVELSRAFGFGIAEDLRSNDFGFSDEIVDTYLKRNISIPSDISLSEEIVIFNGSLVFDQSSESEMSNDAKWLTIMGEPPLRSLFEVALNLPAEFGQADIDQQLEVYKQRSRAEFGTEDLSIFLQLEMVDDLITKYLARSQILQSSNFSSSASIALSLLQS